VPQTAEARVKARGGATTYRTVRRGNRTFLVAIVPKAGPRGGHTVALAGPSSVKPKPRTTRQKVKRVAKQRRLRNTGGT
jgi:hypothetical protein